MENEDHGSLGWWERGIVRDVLVCLLDEPKKC